LHGMLHVAWRMLHGVLYVAWRMLHGVLYVAWRMLHGVLHVAWRVVRCMAHVAWRMLHGVLYVAWRMLHGVLHVAWRMLHGVLYVAWRTLHGMLHGVLHVAWSVDGSAFSCRLSASASASALSRPLLGLMYVPVCSLTSPSPASSALPPAFSPPSSLARSLSRSPSRPAHPAAMRTQLLRAHRVATAGTRHARHNMMQHAPRHAARNMVRHATHNMVQHAARSRAAIGCGSCSCASCTRTSSGSGGSACATEGTRRRTAPCAAQRSCAGTGHRSGSLAAMRRADQLGLAACHFCTATGLVPAVSAPGLAGTGPTPATSAPGLSSPLPHLHCEWSRPCHAGGSPLHRQRCYSHRGGALHARVQHSSTA
jgi:hypothetical protein